MKLEFNYLIGILGLVSLSLWLFASSDLRYTEKHVVFDSISFPWEVNDWIFKGNTAGFSFNYDSILLHPTPAMNNRESYVFSNEKLPSDKSSSQLLRIKAMVRVLDSSAALPGSIVREREAGLMVWLLDSSNKITDYVTIRPFPARTVGSHSIEKTIKLPPHTSSVRIVFMLRDSDAKFSIDSVDVQLVQESRIFKFTRTLLFFIYAATIVLLLVFLGSRGGGAAASIAFLILTAIIAGVIIPDAWRREYADYILEVINSISFVKQNSIDAKLILFKGAHIIAFWMLALFGLLLARLLNIEKLVLGIAFLLFAFSTEVIQMYSYDRESRLTDIGINFLGIILGYLTFSVLSFVKLNIIDKN